MSTISINSNNVQGFALQAEEDTSTKNAELIQDRPRKARKLYIVATVPEVRKNNS